MGGPLQAWGVSILRTSCLQLDTAAGADGRGREKGAAPLDHLQPVLAPGCVGIGFVLLTG